MNGWVERALWWVLLKGLFEELNFLFWKCGFPFPNTRNHLSSWNSKRWCSRLLLFSFFSYAFDCNAKTNRYLSCINSYLSSCLKKKERTNKFFKMKPKCKIKQCNTGLFYSKKTGWKFWIKNITKTITTNRDFASTINESSIIYYIISLASHK